MTGRLSDRTLTAVLVAAAVLLLGAMAFAVWINAGGPPVPVPVPSSPSA